MQKKQDRPFLFLRLFLRSWQMLPIRTLLLSDQKVDLLPQLREQIHLISRFLAVLRLSAKPVSRNFGMTHVGRLRRLVLAEHCDFCETLWGKVKRKRDNWPLRLPHKLADVFTWLHFGIM